MSALSTPGMSAECAFCRRSAAEIVRLVVYGSAAICSECLGATLVLLRREVAERPRVIEVRPAPPAGASSAAAMQGLSGDMCDNCGNFRMVRTGTCTTCLDCGTTGGCG
jgi:hypothetical protein